LLPHLRLNKKLRKFTSNSKGFSSIIGAVFAVLAMISLVSTVFLWSLSQNTQYNDAVRQSNLADLDRSNERILTNVTCYGNPYDSVLVKGTLENYGSLSVQIVSLWVVNANNTKYNYTPLDIVLAPGNTTTINESVTLPNSEGHSLSCWFVSERGNTISEKSMNIINNYSESSNTTYAAVAGGIGLIGFDFKGFRHYDVVAPEAGWIPDDNYPVGTLDGFLKTYHIKPFPQYTIFHVVLTNYDPGEETMYLESNSAIYVIGSHSGTVKYHTWNVINVTGNETTGYSLNPSITANYSLPYETPVHVFFAGENPKAGADIDIGRVYPLNILVHGKLGIEDYGQNVPFVTLYFGY
jgi:hypothetical protein